MKALVGIVVAALIGLNIYQYIDRKDLRQELDLSGATVEAKAEEIAKPLREQTESLKAEKSALEAEVAVLERAAVEAASVAEAAKASEDKNNPLEAFSKAMDNPAMKDIVAAQQKATVDTMYSRLYERLQLGGEELEYFQKLLTDAQLSVMELGMKIISTDLTAEEREQLGLQIKESQDVLKKDVRAFLNDDADYEYYEFYTDTLGERMAMSGLRQALSAKELSIGDDREEQLVRMMQEERQAIQFEDHYYDQNKFDPSTITQAKVDKFMEQYTQLETNVANRAASILSEEQLAVFKENQKGSRAMQEMGLNMMMGMFGKKE